MANLSIWLGLALPAYFIACLAACGAKLLAEFSRSELEAYARRKQSQRFVDIVARHDEVARSAESLMFVMIPIAVIGTLLSCWSVETSMDELTVNRLLLPLAGMALLLLVLLTWIPRALNEVAAAPFVFHTWPLWIVVEYLLWPLTLGGSAMTGIAHRLSGQIPKNESEEEDAFEDEIRSIVSAGLRDGFLEEDMGEMIEGVIELGDADVADIMTPRSDVDALDVELSWPDIISFVVRVGRTRIPVFEKTLDNIVGVLYVKDLLPETLKPEESRRPLRKLLRSARFAPKTLRLDELLREFLNARNHLAIVVDEYGAVEGVVTTEDVLEEIVGEIVDESDREEEQDIIQIDASTADASGRTHVSELNDLFGLELDDGDDYDSVGGLMIQQLGRIPDVGETLVVDSVRLTVLKANPRRVDRVRIEWGGGSRGNSD